MFGRERRERSGVDTSLSTRIKLAASATAVGVPLAVMASESAGMAAELAMPADSEAITARGTPTAVALAASFILVLRLVSTPLLSLRSRPNISGSIVGD